jgi:glucose/mannose transport system permease protein
MTDLSVTQEAVGATIAPHARPYFPRKKKRITGRSIAIIAFLAMCALFFCVPLYVVLTTSLKTMDEIRQGAIFALPQALNFEAWNFAWNEACSGITCEGLRSGS